MFLIPASAEGEKKGERGGSVDFDPYLSQTNMAIGQRKARTAFKNSIPLSDGKEKSLGDYNNFTCRNWEQRGRQELGDGKRRGNDKKKKKTHLLGYFVSRKLIGKKERVPVSNGPFSASSDSEVAKHQAAIPILMQ